MRLVLLFISAVAASQDAPPSSQCEFPRSKVLTVIQSVLGGEINDPELTRSRMRHDMPDLREVPDDILDDFIEDWLTCLGFHSWVPKRFHEIHIEAFPEKPDLETLMHAISVELPPELVKDISDTWFDFCVVPSKLFPDKEICVEQSDGHFRMSDLARDEFLIFLAHNEYASLRRSQMGPPTPAEEAASRDIEAHFAAVLDLPSG